MIPNGPLVSIIITTYSRSVLLKRAIKSVLNQTYKNLEIIIVDDCSSDDTEDVVREFQKIDKRILYIKNDRQSGANVSRNRGVQIAKGDFIAGLDDDDEFLAQRIEHLLNSYDDKFAFITSNNLIIEDKRQRTTKMPAIVKIKDMLINNTLMNQGLIQKERIAEVGMYDEALTACQDYDMWMRLMLRYGDVKVVEDATQIVHMDNNLERISSKSNNKFKGYFSFYKKYKYLMDPFERQQHLFRVYDIKKAKEHNNSLAVKILKKRLLARGIKSFSIFGAGSFLDDLISELQELTDNINFIADSNAYNSPKSVYGYDVIHPKELLARGETTFVIASGYFYNEMKNQLLTLAQETSKEIEVITVARDEEA